MKSLLKHIGLRFVRCMGSRIHDCDTGEFLGHGLFWVIGGRIHLIGYQGLPIIAVFLPMEKVRYWRSCIGFKKHRDVDFPHLIDLCER